MRVPKYATDLGFATKEEYFDYIMESKINGQHAQAKGLYYNLPLDDIKEFYNYVEELYYYEALDNKADFPDEVSELDLLKMYFSKR
jgi:hypothetical protein